MRVVAYTVIAAVAALAAAAVAMLAADRMAHAQMSLGLGLGLSERSRGAGGTTGGSFIAPAVSLNFATGGYNNTAAAGCNSAATCVTTTNSGGMAVDASGIWHNFGANTPRITNLGLTVEEARTNLFLNSQAPVTQTITVVNTSVYTVSVYGTASVVLSGAGTGTVTQGNPVTFTASTTSLVCTVSGAGGTFQNVQVELGAFATTPISTTSAAVTRQADNIMLTTLPTMGSSYTVLGSGAPESPVSNSTAQLVFELDDTTANNRTTAYRAGTADPFIVAGGTTIYAPTLATWPQNTLGKIAVAYRSGAQASAFNGVADNTGVSAAALATPTRLVVSAALANFFWNGTISSVALWPTTALTAAQLRQVTQ